MLRRAMGTELAVGLAVIGVTAAMVVSPPAIAQDNRDSVLATADDADATTTSTTSAAATSDATSTTVTATPTTVASAQPCVIEPASLQAGSSGPSVLCVQQTLMAQGVYVGELSGQFDQATDDAVRSIQQQRGLLVDGIVGRATATALGIWPQS